MFDIIFYNVNAYALYPLQEKARAVRMRLLCKIFDNMTAVYAMFSQHDLSATPSL